MDKRKDEKIILRRRQKTEIDLVAKRGRRIDRARWKVIYFARLRERLD